MYVFVESDLSVLVGIDLSEVPVKLLLSDGGFVDTEVIGKKGSEFFLFEGGAVVLIVGLEDGLEVLFDDWFDVSHLNRYDFKLNKKILRFIIQTQIDSMIYLFVSLSKFKIGKFSNRIWNKLFFYKFLYNLFQRDKFFLSIFTAFMDESVFFLLIEAR